MKYVTEVLYNVETDDYFVELSEEMIESVGWEIGDVLRWSENEDGSFTLTKKEQ